MSNINYTGGAQVYVGTLTRTMDDASGNVANWRRLQADIHRIPCGG